jgi:hypothetical protein
MPDLSTKSVYRILMPAGIVIMPGIASSVYTLTPVDVPLNGTLRHGLTDSLAPKMNRGSTANITLNGSIFNIVITDPDKQLIESRKRHLKFSL